MTAALLRVTNNYAALIKPLQWLVIAVIFLFFLRVARAATVQARTNPKDTASTATRRRDRRLALEFVEPEAREGERVELKGRMSVGRSSSSDLVLDDQFVSSNHARLEYGTDGLFVEDMGSTNGTYVNEALIDGRVQLKRGDVLQFGSFVLEVVR